MDRIAADRHVGTQDGEPARFPGQSIVRRSRCAARRGGGGDAVSLGFLGSERQRPELKAGA